MLRVPDDLIGEATTACLRLVEILRACIGDLGETRDVMFELYGSLVGEGLLIEMLSLSFLACCCLLPSSLNSLKSSNGSCYFGGREPVLSLCFLKSIVISIKDYQLKKAPLYMLIN